MAWYDEHFDRLLSTRDDDGKLVSTIRDLKRSLDAVAAALGVADTPLQEAWLCARDERLEQLHLFARQLARRAGATERQSELDWILNGGRTAFDNAVAVLRRLMEIRARLHALRSACEVLAPLVRVRFLKAHMNFKAPARAVIPSMVALDAVAVTDIERDLASTVGHLDRALATLHAAIEAVTGLLDSQPRPRGTTGGDVR
jgi:hypothetical protein